MMEFKGYLGKVEFDDEVGVFHGEVMNTRDVITFQGESVKELKQAFRDSINDYLAFCEARAESPDKPFSGQFVTRVPPELHRQVSIAAISSGKSLNGWVTEQLRTAVQGGPATQPAVKRTATKSTKRKLDASRKRH